MALNNGYSVSPAEAGGGNSKKLKTRIRGREGTCL
jgi:hypothetical protein